MIKFKVIIDEYETDQPAPHEIKAAYMLAQHLKSDIKFLPKLNGHSPDILVLETQEIWEIKSPEGGGKHTMANNLRRAYTQADKIFIDLNRCKLRDERAIARARDYIKRRHCSFDKVKVLTKSYKILDLV